MNAALGASLDPSSILRLIRQHRVPGVSLAIVRDFEIVEAEGFGIAAAETAAAVTSTTLFQAASISKPVAAMVSLVAVRDGRFTLDQNVDTILRSWHHPAGPLANERPVTPRTLMSHTGGFGDGLGFPGYDPSVPLPTIPQILDGLPPANTEPVRLAWEPSTAWCYSGGGVLIQQLALTDVVGRSFPELAREWVLDPIGMTSSTFEQPLPADKAMQAACGHDDAGRSIGPKWRVYPELAAAGLWSTPSDLARFAIEIQKTLAERPGQVLPGDLMQEMVTPVGGGPFGVGLQVAKVGDEWYFGHDGSNRGYQCELVGHLTKGYGLVIMTNGDGGGSLIEQLRADIGRAFGWIR